MTSEFHQRVLTLLLLALATGAPRARAQWTVQGSGIVSGLRHRVDVGHGVEPSSGVLAGAEVAVGVGERLTVRLLAQAGSLHADVPSAIDRDVADAGARVDVAALRWLTIDAGVRRRAYSTVLARQLWTTFALGAEAHVPFTETGLTGIVRGAILPGVWVSGLAQPDLAVAVASGMEYRRKRATVSLLYGLERYRFAATRAAAERREQLAGLTLAVGWRLTR